MLAGIEALARRTDRIPLGKAWPFAQKILDFLRQLPGCEGGEAGGSLRRMRATVGDLDLLVAASDSAPVMKAFTEHPEVLEVLAQGETKVERRISPQPARPDVGASPRAVRHRPGLWDRLEGPQRAPARAGLETGLIALGPFFLEGRRQRDPVRHRSRKFTRYWICPGFRPSCARIAARCRPPSTGSCRT